MGLPSLMTVPYFQTDKLTFINENDCIVLYTLQQPNDRIVYLGRRCNDLNIQATYYSSIGHHCKIINTHFIRILGDGTLS